MVFDFLKVKHVRNISNTHVEPCPQINLIVGPNASGKTAFLEAIHLLARARSFRSPRIKEVIQRERQTLQVTAQIDSSHRGRVFTGIEKGYGTTIIKYDGKALKTVSEQASNIPLIIITPDSHLLVTGAPKDRRRWLDWALFHVEPSYMTVWRTYQKALRCRNNLLKQGGNNKQLGAWENTMTATADILCALREKFLNNLQRQLSRTVTDSSLINPGLSFYKGCPDDIDFETYLNKEREKDRSAGYTKAGPHKADIHFLANNNLLSQTYSRGQIKRFVVSLLLAQALAFESLNEERPVFLIDDYTAELDTRARAELLGLLQEYGGQIFLTSTEPDRDACDLKAAVLFHVERGNFIKVVK